MASINDFGAKHEWMPLRDIGCFAYELHCLRCDKHVTYADIQRHAVTTLDEAAKLKGPCNGQRQ